MIFQTEAHSTPQHQSLNSTKVAWSFKDLMVLCQMKNSILIKVPFRLAQKVERYLSFSQVSICYHHQFMNCFLNPAYLMSFKILLHQSYPRGCKFAKQKIFTDSKHLVICYFVTWLKWIKVFLALFKSFCHQMSSERNVTPTC